MIPEIVTVGGITLDWVITADRQVGLKECGGNALYSAAGARLWCEQVAVNSRHGNNYPSHHLDAFRQAGIDLTGVRRIEKPHELVFAARYDVDGMRSGFVPREVLPPMGLTTPEAFEEHDYAPDRKNPFSSLWLDPLPEETPLEYWQAKAFHIAGMHYRSQTVFAEELHRRGILFTLDPSTSKISSISSLEERQHLLSLATVFMPSEEQLSWFIEETNPAKALDVLAAFGPQVVLIKLGRNGSLVYDTRSKRRQHIPVYPAHVKDPTGAGDSFCGGFIAGYVETGDVIEATLRATASASFAIEEFSASYALRFNRRDAEARLDILRRSLV